VLNLLSNAVKFTPEGGRVTIRARAAGGWVSVAIADTGIGIPEDALARLGRRSSRSRASSPRAIRARAWGSRSRKSLTELHSGSMRIRSTLGQGTMVLLRLPVTRPAAAREELAEAAA
jgi:two-component system cell cycle sensor histidine kinase PleC